METDLEVSCAGIVVVIDHHWSKKSKIEERFSNSSSSPRRDWHDYT